MVVLLFFISCSAKIIVKLGFEGFLGVKKSSGKTYDDFIPEKWGFGVNFRFSKMTKIRIILSLLKENFLGGGTGPIIGRVAPKGLTFILVKKIFRKN